MERNFDLPCLERFLGSLTASRPPITGTSLSRYYPSPAALIASRSENAQWPWLEYAASLYAMGTVTSKKARKITGPTKA